MHFSFYQNGLYYMYSFVFKLCFHQQVNTCYISEQSLCKGVKFVIVCALTYVNGPLWLRIRLGPVVHYYKQQAMNSKLFLDLDHYFLKINSQVVNDRKFLPGVANLTLDRCKFIIPPAVWEKFLAENGS